MRSSSQRWRLFATVLACGVSVVYAYSLGLGSLERVLSFIVLMYFVGYLAISLGSDKRSLPLPEGRVIAVVPAYNENPERLHDTIRSLLSGTVVPDLVHVVDDGSAEPLPRFYHPRVVWHRQANAGKHHAQATALRAELRRAPFDFVVTVDSDSVVDKHAVERCLRRLSDPKVNAVTGVVYALNRTTNIITRVTDLHYVHSCLVVRGGLSRMGDVFTTSGALAVYRASMWLANLEEYLRLGIADDRHLTHLAQRTGTSVAASDAYVNTFVPDNIPDLLRQRIRWSRDYYRCIILDIKYLRGWSFWMRSVDLTLMTLAPIFAVTAFMVFPSAQWRVPWGGVGLWLAFMYIHTSCYMFHRTQIPLLPRLCGWLLMTPTLYLFQFVVFGPAMVVSLLNIRHPSWQTRNAKPRPATAARPDAASKPAGPGRDLWFDFVRMIAIFRVVYFHATGYFWLGLALPSMGIMFGLAGSLMAGSLAKVGDRPEIMMWSRLRRLVPSVWMLGAVLVPAMLIMGWSGGSRPFNEASIVAWIVPLSDPPGNGWAEPVTGTLWYIRTYIWLVLLSPPLYRAFKRFPRLTIIAPTLLIFFSPYIHWSQWLRDVGVNLGTYTTCWLLGYAHRDGLLNKMTSWTTIAFAVASLGAGFGWMRLYDTKDHLIQGVPLAQLFWCVGFVLLFFRFRPSMEWLSLPLFRPLAWLVKNINSRAVTIYLWHQLAVVLSAPILTWMNVWAVHNRAFWLAAKFTIIITLILIACGLFGRIEDLNGAARRRADQATKAKAAGRTDWSTAETAPSAAENVRSAQPALASAPVTRIPELTVVGRHTASQDRQRRERVRHADSRDV